MGADDLRARRQAAERAWIEGTHAWETYVTACKSKSKTSAATQHEPVILASSSSTSHHMEHISPEDFVSVLLLAPIDGGPSDLPLQSLDQLLYEDDCHDGQLFMQHLDPRGAAGSAGGADRGSPPTKAPRTYSWLFDDDEEECDGSLQPDFPLIPLLAHRRRLHLPSD